MKKNCTCSNKKRKQKYREKQVEGYGLIDFIVNKLPEIHIPGYQYCGPGTELEKRLARGDPGMNKLDKACKDHDIAYSSVKNSKGRREADKVLVARALPRIYSSDAKLGERTAALLVSGLIGAKIGLSKLGLGFQRKNRKLQTLKKMKGHRRIKSKKKKTIRKKNRSKLKRKSITFNELLHGAKTSIKKSTMKSSSLNDTIKAAIRNVKDMKRNKMVKIPRVLKVPKFGGSVLSVLPIISALSGVGTISSSAAAVIKAIKAIQNVKSGASRQVNKKIGRSLNLISNSSGSGFFLRPYKQH